jgi:hypothetical protein
MAEFDNLAKAKKTPHGGKILSQTMINVFSQILCLNPILDNFQIRKLYIYW